MAYVKCFATIFVTGVEEAQLEKKKRKSNDITITSTTTTIVIVIVSELMMNHSILVHVVCVSVPRLFNRLQTVPVREFNRRASKYSSIGSVTVPKDCPTKSSSSQANDISTKTNKSNN